MTSTATADVDTFGQWGSGPVKFDDPRVNRFWDFGRPDNKVFPTSGTVPLGQPHSSASSEERVAVPSFESKRGTSVQSQASTKRFDIVVTYEFSTSPSSVEVVDDAVARLMNTASGIEFEDGMGNAFERELVDLVKRYRKDAVASITKALPKQSAEVQARTLRYLAAVEQPASYLMRLNMMIDALQSKEMVVRDGAALALAEMDEPQAITYLDIAIKREESKSLRKDLEQVRDYIARKS